MAVLVPSKLLWLWHLALVSFCVRLVTAKPNVRVVFLTDCTPYSDWQSIAMVFSYKFSGEDGPINRVMCCSEDERKKYRDEMLKLVETHIAPSFTVHPVSGDIYAAYNKPEAVIDWIEHVTPDEEWLLILDSDMTLRHPFRPEHFNVTKGWAAGARYDYLIGVNNELADRHIPEIPKRNDTLAGPKGRRSDKVGGFFFMHKEDAKRMAKLWLKYTEDVRADPEAWRLSGDMYSTKPGIKPWISEMYGYSFGAAKADLWHKWDEHSMIYPGYNPGGIPKVMHYGLKWDVEDYSFDKHWYTTFDPLACPPWDMVTKRPRAGIFPEPPSIRNLKTKVFVERYRDILAVEVVATLNAGLCDYHVTHCTPHEQMEEACPRQLKIFLEAWKAGRLAEEAWVCMDLHEQCDVWAEGGECKKNPTYMADTCAAACGLCKKKNNHKNIVEELSNVEVTDKELTEHMVRLGWQWLVDKLKHKEARDEAMQGSGQQAVNIIEKNGEEGKKEEVQAGDVASSGKDKTTATTDKAPGDVAPVTSPEPKETGKGEEGAPKELTDPSETKGVESPAPSPLPKKQPAGHIRGAGRGGSPVVKSDTAPKVSGEDVRELTKRCYKMGKLSMEQVRECLTAAKAGNRYNLAPERSPVHQSEEDLTHTVHGGDIGDHTVAREQLGQDESTLTQSLTGQTLVVAPSTNFARSLFHVTSWQGLGVWLVIVAAFVIATPRLFKRVRRHRSGMRSE